MTTQAFVSDTVFDGEGLQPRAVVVTEGRVEALLPLADLPARMKVEALGPGLIAPGFVDLQVNGGGGVNLNDDPSPGTVRRVAEAHARLGTAALLPTLITDRPEAVRAAVEAVEAAISDGVTQVAGIHLEGPHLSVARKGAHDASLIRPMGDSDLAFLMDAARRLPVVLTTVAPETVTPDQIRALAKGGVVVSLGHSNAAYDEVKAAVDAGARMATHLFNAMSQLGNRDPGMVGAALALGQMSAGLIADGVHVHPASIRTALRAKAGPGRIFLVTDAMAVAGTDLDEFTLNGRVVRRAGDRLTLADGTLAGADVDFPRALQVLTQDCEVPLATALAMASSVPASVIGCAGRCGTLSAGRRADFVHLSPDLQLKGVWSGGTRIA